MQDLRHAIPAGSERLRSLARGPGGGELIFRDVCKIALLRRFRRLPHELAMPATMERNDG